MGVKMKRLGRYLLILAVVMILWNTEIIKPLKLFTIFLHELGHAFMAFVFGYGINGLNISLNEGGYTLVQSKGWFSSFMILNAGYLGSVLFAVLILWLRGTAFRKYILGTAAIIMLGIAVRYSGISFTLLYSVIFAVAVILVYMIRNENVYDWIVDILGVSSVAYAIYDTFVDTVLLQLNVSLGLFAGWKVEQPATDAAKLAQLTHIPAIVWGIIWLVISILAVNAVLVKEKPRKR